MSIFKCKEGTSLAVQWLRLRASTAGSMSLIPGQGTKIPRATLCSQEKKNSSAKSWMSFSVNTHMPTTQIPQPLTFPFLFPHPLYLATVVLDAFQNKLYISIHFTPKHISMHFIVTRVHYSFEVF